MIFCATAFTAFPQRTARRSQAVRSIIVTTESGATIWLDGVLRGSADDSGKFVVKPVSKGIHRIRIRAFGFKEINKQVLAAQTSVRAPLEKNFDRAVMLYHEAEKLMAEDKIKAIGKYKESLSLNPRYSDAQLGLARAYAATGDYEDGLAIIKKARLSKRIFPEASAVEGRIYRSNGDIDNAIDSFERAIREGKGFQPEAHTGLALIFKDEAEAARSRGDFEEEKLYYGEAATSFETAIDQLSATEPVVYLLLGQIYEKSHEKEKAIKIYERFLRDMPDHEEHMAVESFIVQLKKPSVI
jgi:tetratricopeptide (TPR) repeat protein